MAIQTDQLVIVTTDIEHLWKVFFERTIVGYYTYSRALDRYQPYTKYHDLLAVCYDADSALEALITWFEKEPS